MHKMFSSLSPPMRTVRNIFQYCQHNAPSKVAPFVRSFTNNNNNWGYREPSRIQTPTFSTGHFCCLQSGLQVGTNQTASQMSTGENHLERTADKQREFQIHQMTIAKIADISPTVKHLVLTTAVKPVPFSFKAGQWVDTFIPDVEIVGGFSICSSPIHLKNTGELHLSVKKSEHPPSNWVHTQCKLGSEVSIRVGGDFFLDTQDLKTAGKSILLVAGGVGINPLASIVAQLQDYNKLIGVYSSNTMLMYSAKTEAELIFKNSFDKASEENPKFSANYFLTGEDRTDQSSIGSSDEISLKYGRITKSDIVRALASKLHLCVGFEDINSNIVVYICGPPPMIQNMESILQSLGITNIFYEKWW